MAEVQRGNVFLTIQEDEIEKYMAKGFSVVDKFGNVIRQSIPTELNQLQKAYSEHVDIINQKNAEIAKLKSELKALKEAGAKKAPAAEPDSDTFEEWADAEVIDEEVPAKKKRRSK